MNEEDLRKLLNELEHLRKQRTELQTRGTELVMENRALKRGVFERIKRAEHVDGEPTTAERVSALFCDDTSNEEVAERIDPADMAGLVRHLFQEKYLDPPDSVGTKAERLKQKITQLLEAEGEEVHIRNGIVFVAFGDGSALDFTEPKTFDANANARDVK